jgi:hypothetical protein
MNDDKSQKIESQSEAPQGPLSREHIYDLVWEEPMLRVAEQLGVSSSYMARVCTELRIPRPPRGYWAQLEFGKAPARPSLPASRAGDIVEWSPGDFIGTTERSAQKQVRSTGTSGEPPSEQGAATRKARSSRTPEIEKIHPMLVGIKPLFLKTRESDSGVLRPYKRLMPDILSSKEGLDAAIAFAELLFRALTKHGHRVTIVPTGVQVRRADVDLREVPRKNHYQQTTWNPERPTAVYIGEVPIGLTLFEMTEQVEMLYVGNSKYIPVRDLTPNQQRKLSDPRHWKTQKDLASGRFCLQAYCPSWRVNWVKRWPEVKPGQLSSLVSTIVSELESAGPELAMKLETARIQAEEEHRRWEEEQRLRREAENQALRAKQRQQSRQELLAAISAWDEAQRIEAYFAEVERSAVGLDDVERRQLLERLSDARKLVGPLDPLKLLLHWKAPPEM